MVILPTDHILGIAGYDVHGPIGAPNGKKYQYASVMATCYRRDGKWLMYLEFLYSNNNDSFSAEDFVSPRTFLVPEPVVDTNAIWIQTREALRNVAMATAGIAAVREFDEILVNGTVSAIPALLATKKSRLFRCMLKNIQDN